MLLQITQPHSTIFAEWRGFKGFEVRKVVVAHECVIKAVVMVVNFRRQRVFDEIRKRSRLIVLT